MSDTPEPEPRPIAAEPADRSRAKPQGRWFSRNAAPDSEQSAVGPATPGRGSPFANMPSAPPTYDPSRRFYAPLPNPAPPTVAVVEPPEDPWWINPWPLAALASAIALVVAASVIGAFLLLDDDSAQLVSLGGRSSVVGGENLSLRGEALDVQGVLSVVSPSVVSIETNVENFRGVFGGSGSGIVVDDNGLILTNAHVIEGADTVEIVFFDGTRAPGVVVSSIVAEDIALVQAQGVTDTLPATLGTVEQLLVGDPVLAIGNALGLGGDPTVTLGILSAKNRQIDAGRLSFEHLLQTDAAINPGNSGGPLVNAAGEVIGINTAIIEGSQNVGFAIAIDSVSEFLDGFASGDASLTPDIAWFGASTQSLAVVSEAQRDKAGVTGDTGVFVIDVFNGSAADRSGLQPGDLITEVNGVVVSTPEDLARLIRRLDPGDVVDLDFRRGGRKLTAQASLGTRADVASGD